MALALPLVSVVVPSLNQGGYIAAAIDSILSQDYPNLEAIVVDGASTDNTIDALKSYGGRIVWISEKDRNLTEAINKGIRLSRGTYLMTLASDEVLYAGAISRLVDTLRSSGAAVAVGNGTIIDEASNEVAAIDNGVGLQFEEVLTLVKKMPLACSLFESRIFREFPLDEEFQVCTDFDFWLRAFPHNKIVFVSDKITKWRRHGGSWSVSLAATEKVFQARQRALAKFFLANSAYGHLRQRAHVGAFWDWALAYLNANKRSEALTVLLRCFRNAPLATLCYDKGVIPRALCVMVRDHLRRRGD